MSEPFEIRDRRILGVATGFGWAGVLIALVSAGAGLTWLFEGQVPVQASTDVPGHGTFEGAVLISDPSWVLILLHLATVLCTAGGMLVIMFAVLWLVRCARRGDAFLPRMRSALIAVAAGIVVWTVGGEMLPGAASILAYGVLPEGFHSYSRITIWPVMLIVVLGVIAAVFDVGARLRHETEGLV
ncbi:MAG: hypothetical protein GX596_04620 [Propionibacterium sp.]|nr:hypothetical protein [Propionibacterium sp.]